MHPPVPPPPGKAPLPGALLAARLTIGLLAAGGLGLGVLLTIFLLAVGAMCTDSGSTAACGHVAWIATAPLWAAGPFCVAALLAVLLTRRIALAWSLGAGLLVAAPVALWIAWVALDFT